MKEIRYVIVLNLGSTSFKFKLFDFKNNEKVLATGEIENIGGSNGRYSISAGSVTHEGECSCRLHGDAFALSIEKLTSSGILRSLDELDAVGYKAVHCGALKGAQQVNDDLIREQEKFVSFAPAHNPVYIGMMKEVARRWPSLKQVAYFETSFHATIPEERVTYGVPYEWKTDNAIRRYGFHGSSHSYIAMKMKELEPDAGRLISIHLGGSSSVCAIRDGESIASSMGATPQSGLFHNNRVGDFDVFCIPELVKKYGDLDTVMKKLSKESGFLGISGVSNDLRDVIAAAESGNKRAILAFDAFCDNIVGYIGMFTAYLQGLDAICFTGGIGLRSSKVRKAVLSRLSWLGVVTDPAQEERQNDGKISDDSSKVKVYVLKTNEELMVARKTVEYLNTH